MKVIYATAKSFNRPGNEIKMGGQGLRSVTADQNKILIITVQAQNINNLITSCFAA